MYDSLLQQLGLSLNEAKIYGALISYGASGVSTISLRSKVHRRNAYDAVHRLLEKGLVSEVFTHGETVYAPVEPGKLMELIREKEMALGAALPAMLSAYRGHHIPQRAYIYTGVEGMKSFMDESLRIGADVYVLGFEGAWFDPRMTTYTDWYLGEIQRKNIKLSVIFDNDILEHRPEYRDMLTKHHKFMPKKYKTTSTMVIFGDHVVTYKDADPGKVDDDVAIFVMVSAEVAESYRSWWRYLWDTLPAPAKRRKR